MQITLSFVIEVLGTAAFAISGVYSALEKKLDILAVVMVAFVTAIGGGTIRDILIGHTPVSWMRNLTGPAVILTTSILTLLFRHSVKNYKAMLFLFDALGLGLFTIIGVQKGLSTGLHPGVCVALGTITGCFGGVCRDVLLNRLPMLFQNEVYATACIIGASAYLLILPLGKDAAELSGVAIVCAIRIVAYSRNWKVPSL